MLSSARFDTWLDSRIKEELPGFKAQARMMRHLSRPPASEAPDNVRLSAVLLLIFFIRHEPYILLIKRTEDKGPHSGQMAFPGGKKDEDDPSLLATALREAYEEVKINTEQVKILGGLSPLYIPVSNFLMYPFVAVDKDYDYWELSPYEVQSVHYYRLDDLFNSKKETSIRMPLIDQKIRTIAYIPDDDNVIWGATAMILSELEDLYNEFISLKEQ